MNNTPASLDNEQHKQCLTDSEKIASFVNQNKTLRIENLDSDKNKVLNIEALNKLVDGAWATIRIYTDSIKDDVHGDDSFIKNISLWIIRNPHAQLKILLKSKQDDLTGTKLYQALLKVDKEYKRQIEIRYLRTPIDTNFNCFIVDYSGYKLKLIKENMAYLSFSDNQSVASVMAVVFNKYFSRFRSIKVEGFSFNSIEFANQFFYKGIDRKIAKANLAKSGAIFEVIPKSFTDFTDFNIQTDAKIN